MSTWTTQVTDAFTRANENPLAGNWTTVTSETAMQLTSNAVVPSALGSDCGARWNARSWTDDHSSSALITCTGTGGTGEGPGLAVRVASGARTYYRFTINKSPDAEIRRFIAGASTQIDHWTPAVWADGDRFTFQVSGPASAAFLEILKNGVSIRTFTDNSSLASGSPGLGYSSTVTAATFDSWEGGELVADPPPGATTAWIGI